ncbi:uncharacterized protein LOC132546660 [Ylistrum balloti]|uniref:uncharacterized protein LOC132546660 n=1 Tax=Ylistrum balloti TaxID=509963 RepID=UPI002905F172|nr:uncharacterized protein LOC132546660 [Ylistrum balloti]
MLQYCRSVLLALRPVCLYSVRKCLNVRQTSNGTNNYVRTRRGTRAGRGAVRPIHSVIGISCTPGKANSNSGVNYNSLVQIITKHGMSTSQPPLSGHAAATAEVSVIRTIVQPRCDVNSWKPIISISRENLVVIKPTTETQPKPGVLLNLVSLNCRSVKNKSLSISDIITSRDIDILAITEAWLGSAVDDQILAELIPTGYDILHNARQGRRGGCSV